jgi:hypothetical protein
VKSRSQPAAVLEVQQNVLDGILEGDRPQPKNVLEFLVAEHVFVCDVRGIIAGIALWQTVQTDGWANFPRCVDCWQGSVNWNTSDIHHLLISCQVNGPEKRC